MDLLLSALVGAVVAVVMFGVLVGFVFLRPHRGTRMAASSRDPGELPRRTPKPPDRGQDQGWTAEDLHRRNGPAWGTQLDPLPPFRGSQELHHDPRRELDERLEAAPTDDEMDQLADAYMAGKHARAGAVAGLSGGPDRRMHRGVWELYAAMAQ